MLFRSSSTSTDRDDSQSTINPNGTKPGRWKRMVWSGINLALSLFTSTTDGIVPASGGGTTNFLRADGSWAPAGAGRLLRAPQNLTSGTSIAKAAGCTFAIVEIWAGGGAGGGSAAVPGDAGMGASAGGFAYWATSTIPAANWSYTIGAGGVGVAGNAGGLGGNTSISNGTTTVTANGGNGGGGGSFSAPGSAPAISTNGSINGSGQPGSQSTTNASSVAFSGSGGSSSWGGAGVGQSNASGTDLTGNAATAYGSAGGGAMGGAGVTAKAGGAGFQGVIRLWEFS